MLTETDGAVLPVLLRMVAQARLRTEVTTKEADHRQPRELEVDLFHRDRDHTEKTHVKT